MFNKKFFLSFLGIFFTAYVSAQESSQNSLDSFSARFITDLRSNESQKLYIVTDRSVIRSGEYIWFRAFLFNSISQKPIIRTAFLFVDVVNDKDVVVKRLLLNAANGQLNARIYFPDSLTTGFYWLRAYTRYLAEHDTAKILVKPLYVFGKDENRNKIPDRKISINKNDAPLLNFFPEGGNIITGINSIVALQTTYKTGEPLSTEVIIKDNRDTIISRFGTDKNGLGKFEFEPSGFRKYRAVIAWFGGEISYPLPPFNFNRGQLSLSKQYNGYKLRILLGDSIYTKDLPSYVMGISKDSLVFAGVGSGQYEVNIDEHQLPQGITTFYLLDKDFKPLSERSIYNDQNITGVQITADKSLYDKRDKVSLDISVKNTNQHFISSEIAVSVSDSILSQVKNECDLSEINYDLGAADNLFLRSHNCFTPEDIDIMMMARNNSSSLLKKAQNQSLDYVDDSLLFIRGTILNNRKEREANRVVTLISNAGATGVFLTDTTDANGRFVFPIYTYSDSTQFAIEIKDMNNRVLNSEVVIDSIDFPIVKTPMFLKKYPTIVPMVFRQRISTYDNLELPGMNGHHLTPVTVSDKTKIVDYDISKRVSPYSAILSGRDLDGRTSLDILILRVSGLQLINGYVTIRGLSTSKAPSPATEPLIIVEGAAIVLPSSNGVGEVSPVMNFLKSLNPRDVDFIEVLKGADAANYGVRGGNGVILINLLHSGRNINSPANNMKIFYREGVKSAAIFPAYSYNAKDKKNVTVTDTRATIFWNGNFLTSDSTSNLITFYTSDVPSTYNITVTGFTASGEFINKTIAIKSR